MPFICLLNGTPSCVSSWNIPIKTQDNIAFVALPQGGGGGGSNPIKIVAMVALVVATVYTGGAVGAAMAQYGVVLLLQELPSAAVCL